MTMQARNWKIGQQVDATPPRGIVGEPINARWHALRVMAGKERAVRETLRAQGVYAFFPEEERHRFERGKKIVTRHAQVTQLVYAKFERLPHWDVLRDRRIITGVICINGRPVDIPGRIIRAIKGLPDRADLIARAEAELASMRPGQTSEILDGPLAGLAVEIETIRDGRVWWATRIGIRGQIEAAGLRGAIQPVTADRIEVIARKHGLDFADACIDASLKHCGDVATEAARKRLAAIRRGV